MVDNLHIFTMRIDAEDTDSLGAVQHSNYLGFMLKARSDWAENLKIGLDWQRQHKIYFAVHSAHIQFIKPALLHQQVEVVSTIRIIRHASMIYDQHLRAVDATDKILCRAEIKVACVDHAMRPCRFPQNPSLTELRRLLL